MQAPPDPHAAEEARELEYLKKKQEENREHVELVLSIISKTMNRYRSAKDPVMRFSLFVDKFCLLLEIATSMLESKLFIDARFANAEDLRKQAKELSTRIQDEMTALQMWIQNPHYDPDHPLGNEMMTAAGSNFQTSSHALASEKGDVGEKGEGVHRP